MTQILTEILAWLTALALGAAYVALLMNAGKKGKRFFVTLLCCAGAAFLLNFIPDCIVIREIAQERPVGTLPVMVLALTHSLELFLFQTHFFDNGYQEFFFGHYDGADGHPLFLFLFITAFVLACITSSALVIRAFTRRRSGQSWLRDNAVAAGTTHIFFLGGKASLLMAESIRSDESCKNDKIVFVGYPDPYKNYVELSLWEKILMVFNSRKEEDRGPFDAVAYSSIPLNETAGAGVCNQMGLKDLRPYLNNDKNRVYLLSDDEEVNLRCANLLISDGCAAHIWCHASREGLNPEFEESLNSKDRAVLHLVDSSFLAVRGIRKDHPDYLPVHFVKAGRDDSGEGWVDSAFNAMVLGFGEMGRDALGFIFENAAFPDSNDGKSPFSCIVYDRRMDSLRKAYLNNCPGMDDKAGIFLEKMEVGSDAFWDSLNERIGSLNYVMICLGSDRVNLSVAIDILKFAYKSAGRLRDDFAILVDIEEPTQLIADTINHYNLSEQYRGGLKAFGNMKEVWTYDNVTNRSIEEKAQRFSYRYERAQGKDEKAARDAWDERDALLRGTDISVINNAIRCKAQDFANSLHIDTKLSLVSQEFREKAAAIAADIPAIENGVVPEKHYTGADESIGRTLRHLAVLEHLRWNASHLALGYVYGKKKDTVIKTHPCIQDFDALDFSTQHYDYLVVKTTLEIWAEEKRETICLLR